MLRFTIVRFIFLALDLAAIAISLPGSRPGDAAFPGANGKIAFSSDRDGNGEIYLMNADGTGQANCTNDPTIDDEAAAWSSDGTKIAFSAGGGSPVDPGEVYVMNADCTDPTNCTNNFAAADAGPTWSPDGAKIAFYSSRDGNDWDIYVMDSDCTQIDIPTRLTNDPAGDFEPAWSPDGTKIAFQSNRDGNAEIYVMNADGTSHRRLTNTLAHESSPNWSPDGSKIAFWSVRDGNAEVYIMDPVDVDSDGNGENQTNRTNSPAGGDAAPGWSPDGAKIAFHSDRDQVTGFEIYVMNADGTGQTRLTFTSAHDFNPDWQPLVDSDGDASLTRTTPVRRTPGLASVAAARLRRSAASRGSRSASPTPRPTCLIRRGATVQGRSWLWLRPGWLRWWPAGGTSRGARGGSG